MIFDGAIYIIPMSRNDFPCAERISRKIFPEWEDFGWYFWLEVAAST